MPYSRHILQSLDITKDTILSFPFTALPNPVRNTFTGTPLAALNGNALLWNSAGVGADSSKILEMSIIHEFGTGWDSPSLVRGRGATIGPDFPILYAISQWGNVDLPANIGSDGWMGIEFGTFNSAATPRLGYGATGSSVSTVYQLRNQIKDPTKWEFILSVSGAGNVERQSFTIPTDSSLGPTNREHRIAMLWDPLTAASKPSITVFIDGIQRVFVDSTILPGYFIAFGSPGATSGILAGLVVWSGTQTGAVNIQAGWSCCNIIVSRLSEIGSGFV